MSRPLRKRQQNLIYHIVSQSIEWTPMMSNDHFKNIFVSVLKNTQKKYIFDLLSYQINDNNVHLIIKTIEGESDILKILQYIRIAIRREMHRNYQN